MSEERLNGIPTRLLGSTGIRLTGLGVGGYHIGKLPDPDLGVRIIRSAIDEGINFLDNAWCYNGGESERIMGRALRDGYRDRVFLMTKNHGRDAVTFAQQLDESLARLQTSWIDLLQLHEIIHDGLPAEIHDHGVLEAALGAREAGKIRFVGFTGHRWPHLFHEMLDLDFPWDTAQFPANLLDAQFRSFTGGVLPRLKERGIGAIGMKSLAGGRLLQTGVTVQEAIGFSLSLPIDTLVSGIDSLDVLSQNLRIARDWLPQTADEQASLLERVAAQATGGSIEYYKTT